MGSSGSHSSKEQVGSSIISAVLRQLTNDEGTRARHSALRQAVAEGRVQDVRILLSSPDTQVNLMETEHHRREEFCSTSLDVAVRSGHVALTQLLCEAGAEVNCVNSNGLTPLHLACQQGNLKLVHLLLNWSAKLNLPDKSGRTPLCIAADNGHKAVVLELLKRGADPNLAGGKGSDCKYRCPLHCAAQQGHADVVDILCQQTATVIDASDFTHRTPLMLGCESGNVRVVRILISAGADINRPNKHGRVPLTYALMSRPLRALCHQGHNARTVYPDALEILKVLLESGAKLNVKDNFNYTAAQYSVLTAGLKNSLVLFFQHGAQMLTDQIHPYLLQGWQDVTNVELLARLSPEFHPFAERVLRECSASFISAEEIQSLRTTLRRPPALKEVCRCAIRVRLQTKTDSSIFPLIDRLPLPHLCRQYLCHADALTHTGLQ